MAATVTIFGLKTRLLPAVLFVILTFLVSENATTPPQETAFTENG